LTERIQGQVHDVTGPWRSQSLDFETVKAMSDALADVANGLDSLAGTLDTDSIGKLGDGLGTTASYLEQNVVPGATRAADQLDASTEALRVDAQRLAELLKETPIDLQAVREIHDGLARFSTGLDQMSTILKLQRFDTMKEGVKGLEGALGTGADQVDRLAGYTYPVVTFNGGKPGVMQKPFWPEGAQIAEGKRKAAEGVNAGGKEAD